MSQMEWVGLLFVMQDCNVPQVLNSWWQIEQCTSLFEIDANFFSKSTEILSLHV